VDADVLEHDRLPTAPHRYEPARRWWRFERELTQRIRLRLLVIAEFQHGIGHRAARVAHATVDAATHRAQWLKGDIETPTGGLLARQPLRCEADAEEPELHTCRQWRMGEPILAVSSTARRRQHRRNRVRQRARELSEPHHVRRNHDVAKRRAIVAARNAATHRD